MLWLPVAAILKCSQISWTRLINWHSRWASGASFGKSHIFISLDSSGISHLVHLYSLWICETCQLKNFFLKYSSQSRRDCTIEELAQQRQRKYRSEIHSGKTFCTSKQVAITATEELLPLMTVFPPEYRQKRDLISFQLGKVRTTCTQ